MVTKWFCDIMPMSLLSGYDQFVMAYAFYTSDI